MDEKITIIDVARLSGVSKGTVDRVLHNRGEVSKKSAEKVRKAIEELDFHPNMHASLLASRRPKVIACLMPECKDGEFWEKIRDGFLLGSSRVEEKNVRTQVFFYDQYDEADFVRAGDELLKAKPDGVILPMLFQDATLEFAGRLSEAGIPYVYVDTKAEEDNGYLAFFGMPRHDSGVLVAALLTERVPENQVKDILIVRVRRDFGGMSDPTARRRVGFLSYVGEHFPDAAVHNLFINPSDSESTDKSLSEYLSGHPETKLVVMFNSRVHLLAKSLASHPSEGRRVIGFDDLPQNISMLRDGLADILVSHHVEKECARGIEILADFILTRKLPEVKDNYAHIDILTRYNLENF